MLRGTAHSQHHSALHSSPTHHPLPLVKLVLLVVVHLLGLRPRNRHRVRPIRRLRHGLRTRGHSGGSLCGSVRCIRCVHVNKATARPRTTLTTPRTLVCVGTTLLRMESIYPFRPHLLTTPHTLACVSAIWWPVLRKMVQAETAKLAWRMVAAPT